MVCCSKSKIREPKVSAAVKTSALRKGNSTEAAAPLTKRLSVVSRQSGVQKNQLLPSSYSKSGFQPPVSYRESQSQRHMSHRSASLNLGHHDVPLGVMKDRERRFNYRGLDSHDHQSSGKHRCHHHHHHRHHHRRSSSGHHKCCSKGNAERPIIHIHNLLPRRKSVKQAPLTMHCNIHPKQDAGMPCCRQECSCRVSPCQLSCQQSCCNALNCCEQNQSCGVPTYIYPPVDNSTYSPFPLQSIGSYPPPPTSPYHWQDMGRTVSSPIPLSAGYQQPLALPPYTPGYPMIN